MYLYYIIIKNIIKNIILLICKYYEFVNIILITDKDIIRNIYN